MSWFNWLHMENVIGVEITRIKTLEKKQIEELVVNHLRLKLQLERGRAG